MSRIKAGVSRRPKTLSLRRARLLGDNASDKKRFSPRLQRSWIYAYPSSITVGKTAREKWDQKKNKCIAKALDLDINKKTGDDFSTNQGVRVKTIKTRCGAPRTQPLEDFIMLKDHAFLSRANSLGSVHARGRLRTGLPFYDPMANVRVRLFNARKSDHRFVRFQLSRVCGSTDSRKFAALL